MLQLRRAQIPGQLRNQMPLPVTSSVGLGAYSTISAEWFGRRDQFLDGAASKFNKKMPSPTTRSGHAEAGGGSHLSSRESLGRQGRDAGTISCRAPRRAPWRPRRRGASREQRAHAPCAHGTLPSRDDRSHDAWPLPRGVWRRGHDVLTPACDVPQLFSTWGFPLTAPV